MAVDRTLEFDSKLARECAKAFSISTGLGCTESGIDGKVINEYGLGCASCHLCSTFGIDRQRCEQAQYYGMTEAERFGGKYIYFCPVGLTYFVTPIAGKYSSAAKITVGPFIMVEKEDFIAFELQEKLKLTPEQLEAASHELSVIPYVSPTRVHSLSTLLFMAVGFLNDVSTTNKLLEKQDSNEIQGEINQYITELKGTNKPHNYPLITEKMLLKSIAQADKPQAQKYLNELLGHIFFSSGELSSIKARINDLIILISRAAADGGADPEYVLKLNDKYFRQIQSVNTVDELCFWLTGVMNTFLNSVFLFTDVKHMDVIHKAIAYLRENYNRKITLDDVAREVYLSPPYLSKIFKREMGSNFSTYLNEIRIEKSKTLLLTENIRMIDIAMMVGFEDQSYFTKVFKRLVGVSPNRYRETKGHVKSSKLTDGNEIH